MVEVKNSTRMILDQLTARVSCLQEKRIRMEGDSTVDSLAAVKLEVKASNRIGALTLEVAEGTPV